MQILLFLLVIAVPIAEIALFVEAAKFIGIIPTILLTFATAVLGSYLMRAQGLITLSRIAESAEKGEMPIAPVLDGMGIFVAGIMLLTPGFLSDLFGLLLFIPPIRRSVGRWIFGRLARGGQVRFSTYGASTGPRPQPTKPRPAGPQSARPPRDGFKKADDVVDAEFETIEPEDETDPKTSNVEPLDAKNRARRRSPWRRQ